MKIKIYFRIIIGLVCVFFIFTACGRVGNDDIVQSVNDSEYIVNEVELSDESIYSELQKSKLLDGTFNTYLRLVNDLGYAEVLSKTGSKTIFPANDAAFEAFFKDGNNKFGKSSYEELTKSEKAQLLFSSMLDNAILLGNLSSATTDGTLLQGQIVKHPTNIKLVQSVEPLFSQNMPANNPYFAPWKDKGLSFNALYDNTPAPMVHFSGEYFLNNAMTVSGSNATDFKVLTGHDYVDGCAYIFDKQVMLQQGPDTKYGDITCQNGYIHQLDEVLVNPGNMAQILRANSDTKHISRMMDYFAVPVLVDDETFRKEYAEYNAESGAQGPVYAIRYLSKNSQRRKFNRPTETSSTIGDQVLLDFDPGWNNYNPTTGGGTDGGQAEIAAILCPTDDVIERYFSHDGAYIVKNLGVPGLPYDEANIKSTINQHLDAIYNKEPEIFTSMLNNIMKPYLTKTVPSKFSTVQNDVFEFLEDANGNPLSVNHLITKADGNYDVQIANNGVIYKMNTFFAPTKYRSVLGISAVNKDYSVMKNFLEDKTEGGSSSKYGADMYFYLISMKSWFNLLLPKNSKVDNFAKDFIYLDPSSVSHNDGPYCLRFYYDGEGELQCDRYINNSGTIEIDAAKGQTKAASGEFNTAIQDMLNYATIVLDNDDYLGKDGNNYYKTKHGGTIYYKDNKVYGGVQKDAMTNCGSVYIQPSNIIDINDEENGKVYCLDRPVQPTVLSTIDMLKRYNSTVVADGFTKFISFLEGFGTHDEDLKTAGISNTPYPVSGISEVERYHMIDLAANTLSENGNLSFLNAYNYTLFAPTDAAMDIAYSNGLPSWTDFEATVNSNPDKAKQMVQTMRDFVYYHVINGTVYADNTVAAGNYSTFYSDKNSIIQKLKISGGSGILKVQEIYDGSLGSIHSVQENSATANIMSRDIYLNDIRKQATKMTSSSFVIIHGIDMPLCYNKNGKY